MRGKLTNISQFWATDKAMSIFLGLLCLLLFVAPPLTGEQDPGRSICRDVLQRLKTGKASPRTADRAASSKDEAKHPVSGEFLVS